MSSSTRCDGCGRKFTDQRYLHSHEPRCADLAKKNKRLWSKLKKAPKDSPVPEPSEAGGSKRKLFKLPMLSASLFSTTNKKKRVAVDENLSELLPSEDPQNPVGYDAMSVDVQVNEEPPPDQNISVPDPLESTGLLPPVLDMQPLPKRVRKPTQRLLAMLEDTLPEGPGNLTDEDPIHAANSEVPPPLSIRIRRIFRTTANRFGLSRLYFGRPSGLPPARSADHFVAEDLRPPSSHEPPKIRSASDILYPYPNKSAYLLNRWFWDGNQKSQRSRKDLVEGVLHNPEFSLADVPTDAQMRRIDEKLTLNPGGQDEKSGWRVSDVTIDIPTGQKETKATRKAAAAQQQRLRRVLEDEETSGSEEDSADSRPRASRRFTIPGFHHRDLLHLLQERYSGPEARFFHWHPFEERWQCPWDPDSSERVMHDFCGSDCFLRADKELQQSPPEAGCDLPRSIAPSMFYSDATHVAQFGNQKLWPIYSYDGGQSKYDRGKTSTSNAHTIAFLPTLPDTIVDFILEDPSGKVSDSILTHCRRELFHACWGKLLNEEFLFAYQHGIVVDCGDGIKRRLYPRIVLYSADYPEKVLIATIRDLGQCPCPRCCIPKTRLIGFATPTDMEDRRRLARHDTAERRAKVADARSLIYDHGYAVNSAKVDDLLKSESLVPTINAFSSLQPFGLDFYSLLVVDTMHEIELGIWKALLQHLIRMLHALGAHAVHEFDRRFRQVSSFGRSTIRGFSNNVSGLSRLAARDFEDILQCCIPCFEGLFPSPHNETILDLLYLMNTWHSLAKLRMQTDSSMDVFRQATTLLGDALRYFALETCNYFKTVETDREYQARTRAHARRVAKALASAATSALPTESLPANEVDSSTAPAPPPPPAVGGKRSKTFNLYTPKNHAFPDYLEQIKEFGTPDGFSTLLGETNHRVTKGRNGRTNNNNTVPQIVKMDTRDAVHERIAHQLAQLSMSHKNKTPTPTTPSSDFVVSYHIATQDEKNRLYIPDLLDANKQDPAFKDFVPKLKAHLLSRKQGEVPFSELDFQGDIDNTKVILRDNCLFSHATAKFNFTTYDVRRDQDTINVNTPRRDVMLPSFEQQEAGMKWHPYWYARVLGVYHANIYFHGSLKSEKMDFLWVRWFGKDPNWTGGPSSLRPDRIGFVPSSDRDAFGFLDPALVLRACHLVPEFQGGRTLRLLGPSFSRDEDGDWERYYVMRFVDRDMMMRYLGTGVGHCQPADFPREVNDLPVILARNSNYKPISYDSEERVLPGNDEEDSYNASQDEEDEEEEEEDEDEDEF